MPISYARAALDPVAWAREELGFEPYTWQERALKSTHKRKLFNCGRQSGKSTCAALKALHRSIYYPSPLIILLSPSQRQSSELFRKVIEFRESLPHPPELLEDNILSMTIAGKEGRPDGRIVSLPGNEKTIRGYSKASLIIEDEAAAVPDPIYKAVRPMLAVSNGEYDMMSTPRGKKGHFYEAYASGRWETYTFTAKENPNITPEFLEDELRELGSRMFAQEYLCEFLEDQEGGLFQRGWFDGKLVDDYPKAHYSARGWDMAATEAIGTQDPDWTAGCRMVEHKGQVWIVNCRHFRKSPLGNEREVRAAAEQDGYYTHQLMEEEGGSSGKAMTDHYAREVLPGYVFKGIRSTGSKVDRAQAFSAACEAGNVFIVRGKDWDWQGFIDELCAFPMEGVHDDRVDAASLTFNYLLRNRGGEPVPESEAFVPVDIPTL
jgi:predicted phage terminase large subunit-like protein